MDEPKEVRQSTVTGDTHLNDAPHYTIDPRKQAQKSGVTYDHAYDMLREDLDMPVISGKNDSSTVEKK